ncbi:MAG: hypothetical protein KJ954_13765 [Alphaproteobacteria bacterium]|nr:hypothetical protein [Alphaproteobacteria bacterium]
MYQVQVRWCAENLVWSRWYGMRLYTNEKDAEDARVMLETNNGRHNYQWQVIESDPATEHECVFMH